MGMAETIFAFWPGGRVNETWMDSAGKIVRRDQNGVSTYDATSTKVGKYDPVYTYDDNGNPVKETYPDGAFITREYNGPKGELTLVIGSLGGHWGRISTNDK